MVTDPLPLPAFPQPKTVPLVRQGEIVELSRRDLDPPKNFFGVAVGFYQLARITYGHVEPRFDYVFLDERLRIDLGAPLDFLLFDETVPEDQARSRVGEFRRSDWDDHPADELRVLRHISWGKKGDPLQLAIGRTEAYTLGHGTVMRRYDPGLQFDEVKVGARGRYEDDYGKLELLTADLARWDLLGVSGEARPLRLLGVEGPLARLGLGATYVVDRSAPYSYQHDRWGKLVRDEQGRPEPEELRPAQVVGGHLAGDFYGDDTILVQGYADYSRLIGHGGGFTAGLLQRYSLAHERLAFELRTELLSFDADYLPVYFDELYGVEREGMVGETIEQDDSPKAAALASRAGGPRRLGYSVELSASLVGWLGLAAGLQDVDHGNDRRLLLHAEVPLTRWLQAFLTYEKRSFDALLPLFDFNRDNQIFYHGLRLRLFPFFAVCYRSQRAFQTDANLRRRQNVFQFQVDAELGWSF